MESPDCLLCGSADHRVKYHVYVSPRRLRYYRYARHMPAGRPFQGDFALRQCRDCGFIFSSPRLSEDQLAQVYGNNAAISGRWFNFPYLFSNQPDDALDIPKGLAVDTVVNRVRLRVMAQYGAQPGQTLLDVGAGSGAFVKAALEAGYDARGIDLSAERLERGRQELDLDGRLSQQSLEELVAEGKTYDIVTLFDLIEHVPDPVGYLRAVRQLCHSSTQLYIMTMSTDCLTYKLFGRRWYYIHPVIHLSYFSNKTLRQALEVAGFELVGRELDHTRHRHLGHLLRGIAGAWANHFFFRVFGGNKHPLRRLRPLFRPWMKGRTYAQMEQRAENLWPNSAYVGRWHDDFLFVARPTD